MLYPKNISHFMKSSLISLLFFTIGCSGTKVSSTPIGDASRNTGTLVEIQTETAMPKQVSGPMATAQALSSQIAFSTKQPPEPFPDSWVPWLKENSHPFQSITDENFSDLEFLIPLLENRRIVQLGENSHVTSEYSTAKVRLIKFLHEELGYNVIAFESGLFEGYVTNRDVAKFTPEETMRNSIFGIWHTSEVLELFYYIEETQNTDQPLNLAGFDIQPSGKARDQSSKFLYDVIATIDQDYANEVFAFDSSFWESYNLLSDTRNMDDLIAAIAKLDLLSSYISLTEFFDDHMEELLVIYTEDVSVPLIAHQTAWSSARYIEQLSSSLYTAVQIRDQSMATNVDFLVNELYPTEKIIIWAHNGHIANNSNQAPFPMGSFISDKYGEDVYTIGLYSYGEQSEEAKSYLAGTMQALLYEVGKPYLFIDLSQHQRASGNEWIFDGLKIYDFVFPDFKPVVRNYFDGILYIDSVSHPHYMEWSHRQ